MQQEGSPPIVADHLCLCARVKDRRPPKWIVLSPTLAAAVILEFFRLPASAIMVLDYGDGDDGLDLEMVMMTTTMIQTILSLLAAVTWGACRSIQPPRLLTSLLIGHCEQ